MQKFQSFFNIFDIDQILLHKVYFGEKTFDISSCVFLQNQLDLAQKFILSRVLSQIGLNCLYNSVRFYRSQI